MLTNPRIGHSSTVRIDAYGLSVINYLKSLALYSGVLKVLIWKDLKQRFKYRWLVITSIFFQPLASTFTIVICFNQILNQGLNLKGYPMAVFLSMWVWQFISRSINMGANSLRMNDDAMARVYFPRILLPISVAICGLVDLVIGLPGVFIVGMLSKTEVSWHLFYLLPPLLIMLVLCSVGFSMLFALVEFVYEDISFMMPFINQSIFILSPIVYISSGIPKEYIIALSINPLCFLIEGLRYAILGTSVPFFETVLIGSIGIVLLNLVGLWGFCRCEINFGDKVSA